MKKQENPETILVVDDAPENIDVLIGILRDAYRVKVATRGTQALSIARGTEPPDLILLDVMMPGMDGYAVCESLKADPLTSSIPIIFITARTEISDVVKGFHYGAVDYVTKPFNGLELMARVETQMMILRQRRQLEQQNQELEARSIEYRELLHVLSHDLANHLTALKMTVEFVDSGDDESLDDYMDELRIVVDNGLEVITLVRYLRSLEGRGITLKPVNVLHAFQEALLILRRRADDKELDIQLDAPEELMALADSISLANNVVSNLLSNAIKFSHRKGRIILKAEALNDKVIVTVRDFGVGMPQEIIDNLFSIAATSSRPGTEGEKGTGFGMSLVKKFVDLYGGKILVQSRPGPAGDPESGTTFTIELLPHHDRN